MSVSYQVFFVLNWLSAILAVPAAIALAVLSLLDAFENEARISFGGVSIFAVMWTIFLRLHSQRTRIRAGSSPLGCSDAPFTEEQLVAAVARIVKNTGNPPEIISGGWGFFLWRRRAARSRIFLHNFRGLNSNSNDRWRAGTPLAQVAKELKKRNLVFPSSPTMDFIGVGTWFAMSNHGNGGDANTGSSKCLLDARVLNMETGSIDTIRYAELRRRFDYSPKQYLILDVRFQNLITNTDLHKRALIVDSPDSAAAWLAPGAVLRVLFLGSARSYGLGIRWTNAVPDELPEHRDPHFGSRVCLFWQADVFSALCCGWHEPLSNFSSVESHYNANRWTPTVLPLMTVSVVLGGYKNFEVIFKLDDALNGNRLFRLISSMHGLHRRLGGRTEIRCGATASSAPIFMDCVLRKGFSEVFQLLADEFAVTECALHTSKAQTLTSPLNKVSYGTMLGIETRQQP